MEQIYHLAYTSKAAKKFSNEELIDLLDICRDNNKKLNITGILLYDGNTFFQIIEGPAPAIANLYKALTMDIRHTNVIKIIHEKIIARSFSGWNMGFELVTNDILKNIDGVNDLFVRHKFMEDLNVSSH